MTDAELGRALVDMGIDADSYRLVALLPLVQVAWADGRVQPPERSLILRIADRYRLDDRARAILDGWLAKAPDQGTFLRARQVLLALLAREAHPDAAPAAVETLLELCEEVARSAGGLFGVLFTVDAREREMLKELAAALSLGPRLPDDLRRALQAGVTTAVRRVPASELPTQIRPRPKLPPRSQASGPPRFARAEDARASVAPPDDERTETFPDGITPASDDDDDDEVTEPFYR